MSENENTTTQAPAATPAPQAGPSVEEIKAQLQAEFDRTREGLLRDLQEERRKRQEAEQRLATPAPSAVKPDEESDELFKVVAPVIDKHPIVQQAKALLERQKEEAIVTDESNAMKFLSEKTGKTKDALLADKALQDRLVKLQSEYNFAGSKESIVKRLYRVMELEDLKTQEAERQRVNRANDASSMPSGSAPAPAVSGKEYSAEAFDKMPSSEFSALSAKGDFRKVDGKFVYTPRS